MMTEKISILVIHIFFIEFVIAKQICISFWKLGEIISLQEVLVAGQRK